MRSVDHNRTEDPRFTEFLGKQFNLFQDKQQIFIDYLGVPQPLSACIKAVAHDAGMYAALTLLANAQDRVDENGTFTLDDSDTHEIDLLHDRLLDFISKHVFPNFDERLIDIQPDEYGDLIEDNYNSGLESILNQR